MLTDALRAEFEAICTAERVYHQPAQLLSYSYDGTFSNTFPTSSCRQ